MQTIESNNEYYNETFNKLELNDEAFTQCEFEECEFIDCHFSSAEFRSSKFINCTFTRCNLSLLRIPFSKFNEVVFNACKMVGIDWTRAEWPTYRVDAELTFTQCILTDASFFGLTLHSLSMTECKLHDVDFRDGDFTESTLTYCDFDRAQFMRTNLQNADFTESTNVFLNVLENRVAGAKFSRYEALNLLESLGIELVD
ncbi:pentapeptide repeat-containing protein [Enterovibrio baiacu]|uniref:pentapeptide repeat-containing protein n=1 Tax=Enterovibrio baiacu TaxID=2491023 RepID=UPI001011C0A0|nr:pentapeptide repeat-containing protein [Enterovibrio baiacu]MBE1275331.1 pentapeptide repeat-containing protein [Enterovibrio baiacu]